jgi:hypothetical protein
MINEFVKVGDEVQVPGIKTPVKITFVGKICADAIGPKGRKIGFVQNDHDKKIYYLYNHVSGVIDMHKNDTIESKLKTYTGQDIIEFLESQIEYFLIRRAGSRGEEKAHYQTQLDISGTALKMHKTGAI